MTFLLSVVCWEWYIDFVQVQRKQQHQTDGPEKYHVLISLKGISYLARTKQQQRATVYLQVHIVLHNHTLFTYGENNTFCTVYLRTLSLNDFYSLMSSINVSCLSVFDNTSTRLYFTVCHNTLVGFDVDWVYDIPTQYRS